MNVTNGSFLLLSSILQDRQVSELAQDLATKLGLKVRKAYISPQTESTATEGESHGETSPPTGEVGAARTVWSYRVGMRLNSKSLFNVCPFCRCPPMGWNL